MEHAMGDPTTRRGILIALTGAVGAAVMMASAAAPTARADAYADIIAAINGDYAAGQADYASALADFGKGAFDPALAESFDGANEYTLAAPDNLLLGLVQALTGDPITSTFHFDELSAPGSFADALEEAQILYGEGAGLLANGADALAAGDYGAGIYLDLVGSADAYVLPVEELILGAVAAIDPVTLF
jgi:hypothetical protein